MEILRLQQRIGYQFNSEKLLKQALTHRSVSPQNYERLEFLGDSLLSTIIAQYLYTRFPKDNEGRLTRMRSTLVRQETLAMIAKSLELGQNMILSQGEKKSGGHNRESILADVVEALIGAIWLDCHQIETLRECVLMWYSPYLADIEPSEKLKDPKTRVQEWLQARSLPLPQYQTLKVVGDAPNQHFTVQCTLLDKSRTEHQFIGEGSSRRNAEQTVASQILTFLEIQQ